MMSLFTALLVIILASTISAEFLATGGSKETDTLAEVQAIAGLFEGCYGDTEKSLNAAKNYHQSLPKNTNAICVSICKDNGYVIAATRGADCYCSNSFPTPVRHLPYEKESAGNGGPCSTKCSGAYTSGDCKGDECCGGQDAYTVYLVGETDVLGQLIDRIVTNFQLDGDRMHNNILSANEKAALECQCFNGEISLILTAKTINKNGEGGIKTLKVQFIDGKPSKPTEIQPIKELKETKLIMKSIEKLLQSEEPIFEKAFANWDVLCDNYFGDGGLECSKEFQQTVGFEETFSVEHGVDVSILFGLEVTVDALFAESTKKFEFNIAYSYTNGYSKTTSSEQSESFGIEVEAEKGTKVEVRFFKSDQPVKIKWRAKFLADGDVLIRYGGTFHKIVDLSQVLTYDQRELFAVGTIDYGERPTIIARTRALDKDGNIISTSQEKKELQLK